MIGTAAAILGAAVIGGVGSAMASNKAAKASEHAADESAAVTREIYQQQRADQQPFVQAGYGAVNALSGRLRLPTQGVAPSQPTYGDNGMPPPANRTSVVGAQGMGGYGPSVTSPAHSGYDVNGAAPGDPGYDPTGGSRNVEPTGGGGMNALAKSGFAGTSPLPDPNKGNWQTAGADDPYYMPDGTPSNAQPGGQPLPGNALAGSDSPGTYGSTYTDRSYTPPPAYETPAYTPPEDFNFSVDSFTNNPAFKFAMEQGSGQVLANAGATGALHSGAALKRLQDRGQQTAYQFFAPERDAAYSRFADQRNFGRSTYEDSRNFGYGKSVDERNFGRASFDTDRAFDYGAGLDQRNYLTGRFDRGTDDLFRVSGMGAAAAGANGQAGQNYASGMTGILQGNAANQGNAAIAGANNMNALLGTGVSALAYYNGSKGAPANAATANFLKGADAANPYLF